MKNEYKNLDISFIRVNSISEPDQELVDSIKKYGVREPLIVNEINGNYFLIDGERRYSALKSLNISPVPCIIKHDCFIEDNEKKNNVIVTNPIEEAETYNELLDSGLSQEDIAYKFGKSQSAVANKIRLLKLPEVVKQSLINGEITERHARDLLTVESENKQIYFLNRIKNEGLSVRQLESEIKNMGMFIPDDLENQNNNNQNNGGFSQEPINTFDMNNGMGMNNMVGNMNNNPVPPAPTPNQELNPFASIRQNTLNQTTPNMISDMNSTGNFGINNENSMGNMNGNDNSMNNGMNNNMGPIPEPGLGNSMINTSPMMNQPMDISAPTNFIPVPDAPAPVINPEPTLMNTMDNNMNNSMNNNMNNNMSNPMNNTTTPINPDNNSGNSFINPNMMNNNDNSMNNGNMDNNMMNNPMNSNPIPAPTPTAPNSNPLSNLTPMDGNLSNMNNNSNDSNDSTTTTTDSEPDFTSLDTSKKFDASEYTNESYISPTTDFTNLGGDNPEVTSGVNPDDNFNSADSIDDLDAVIRLLKHDIDKIKQGNVKVDTVETDYPDSYQIVITVDKRAQ